MNGSQAMIDVARDYYRAYEIGDRTLIESLVSHDFHFTSPIDNRIDRSTYFERCWPSHEAIDGYAFVHVVPDGERVIVTYEGTRVDRSVFRNTEILTIHNGKVVDVEVYFGWSVPHPAPAGRALEDDAAASRHS